MSDEARAVAYVDPYQPTGRLRWWVTRECPQCPRLQQEWKAVIGKPATVWRDVPIEVAT